MDSSAVLRAIIETDATPEVERDLRRAQTLITSRLAIVETARALARLRSEGTLAETSIDAAAREMGTLWRHCEVVELTVAVCSLAAEVLPLTRLRTLDALHLSTYLIARRKIPRLRLLSVDERLNRAVSDAGG